MTSNTDDAAPGEWHLGEAYADDGVLDPCILDSNDDVVIQDVTPEEAALIIADHRKAQMVDGLAKALETLVNRLLFIHEDPDYKSVWVMAQVHSNPYKGPTYADQLATARAALAQYHAATEEATRP